MLVHLYCQKVKSREGWMSRGKSSGPVMSPNQVETRVQYAHGLQKDANLQGPPLVNRGATIPARQRQDAQFGDGVDTNPAALVIERIQYKFYTYYYFCRFAAGISGSGLGEIHATPLCNPKPQIRFASGKKSLGCLNLPCAFYFSGSSPCSASVSQRLRL